MSKLNSLASMIKALRKEQRLTQIAVAQALGISQAAYARYEAGEREPSIDMLIILAELFRVPIDVLVGRYETPDRMIPMIVDKVIRSKKVINGVEKEVLSFRSKDYVEPPEETT